MEDVQAPRSGAGCTDGTDYEYIYPAYLSLRLLANKDVKNFYLASNVKDCEDFDDLLVTIQLRSGKSHHFKMQLKHTMNKQLYSRDLEGSLLKQKNKNDFKLLKYKNSYENLRNPKTNFILFTTANIVADDGLKFETFLMEPSKACPGHLFFNTVRDKPSVYRFKVKSEYEHDEDMPIYIKFFKKFTFYVRQRKNWEVTRNVEEIFRKDYHNQGAALKFIDFFKNWHKNNKFNSMVMNREIVKIQLLNCLLENNFINPLMKSEVRNEKTMMLESAIENFPLTIINTNNEEFLNEKWQIHYEEVNPEDILNIGMDNMLTVENFKISELDDNLKWKILQSIGKYPTILKVTEKSENTVKSVLNQFLNDDTTIQRFVLIGPNALAMEDSVSGIDGLRIFRNLRDLGEQSIIFENFTVSIQGRPEIPIASLLKISQQLGKLITVKELFLMLDKNQPLIIGGNKEIMPEYYIGRKVRKFLYNIITLARIENDLIVVNCKGHIERITEFIKSILPKRNITSEKEFKENLSSSGRPTSISSQTSKRGKEDNLVLLNEKNDEFIHEIIDGRPKMNIHIFELMDFDQFEHIRTINSFKSIKEIPVENFKFLDESTMFNEFPNSINIVSSKAGMGKSTMLKYLRNTCPDVHWTVKVNLKQYHDHFIREEKKREIYNHLLSNEEKSIKNEFSKRFFSILKSEKKITFFFDQLDEIDRKFVERVCAKIEFIKKMGYNLWIFTRPDLQDQLETYFNTTSIDIKEFQEDEQKTFLSYRLENAGRSEEEIREIIKGVFGNFKMVVNGEVLGTPLQLYIITEILTRRKYSELMEKIFILTDMYDVFMDGKYDHFLENNSTSVDIDGIRGLVRDSKIYRFSQYKIAALRSCFNPHILKTNFRPSHIDCDKFLTDVRKFGDYLGIIEHVSDDNTISFMHQTFAEFFAAQWLAENHEKVENMGSFIFDEMYTGIRFMFDMICGKNQKAHMGVLYADYASLMQLKPAEIDVRDKCGRNPLQIGCSWGHRHNLLESSLQNVPTIRKKNSRYAEIIEFLARQIDPKIKDKLYQLNSIKYADRALSLEALEAMMIDNRKIKLTKLQNFKDMRTVAYYCVQFNYPKLFFNLKNIPDTSAILKLAIENNRSQFVKRILDKNWKSRKIIKMENLLHNASSAEIVDVLIDKGADVNQINEWGQSPLEIAVYSGNLDTVRRLKEKSGKTILYRFKDHDRMMSFIEIGNLRVVRNLLEIGAIELNKRDALNDTALHLAVKYPKNSAIVKVLVNAGAQLNVKDECGNTPLIIAAFKSNVNIVRYLIEKGAKLRSVNKIKNTALIVAVDNFLRHEAGKEITPHKLQRYRFSKLNQYIQCKPNDYKTRRNKDMRDKYSDIGMVKYLVENGADVNAVDDVEPHPLLSAILLKKYHIIKFLLENDANPLCENTMGKTILEYLEKRTEFSNVFHNVTYFMSQCNYVKDYKFNLSKLNRVIYDRRAHSRDKFEIIKLIVEADTDKNVINLFGDDNRSALAYAVEHNHFDLVKLLIENGADPQNVNNAGNSALMHPKINRQIFDYLLEESPEIINKPNIHAETPIMLAVLRIDLDLVSYLITKGADPNVRDGDGNSPILKAAELGYDNIVEFLFKVPGVDTNIADHKGRTLLEKAVVHGHFHLVKFLMENGINNCSAIREEFLLHGALAHKEILDYLVQREIINDDHFKKYMKTDKIDGALLCRSIQRRNISLVKYLVDNGADVNEIFKRRTSLGHAAAAQDIEIAKFLMTKGAKVELAHREINRAVIWNQDFVSLLAENCDFTSDSNA